MNIIKEFSLVRKLRNYDRVRWGGMGMWGGMGSLLIFELQKKAKKI